MEREHEIFIDYVKELMEDFGLDAKTASDIAHDHLKDDGRTITNSPEEYLNTKLQGCSHCN